MNEPKDDFLDHIKQTLSHHEESYDEGAWERFAAKHQPAVRKRAVVPIWGWAGAAAAAVTGLVFLIQFLNTSKHSTTLKEPEITVSAPIPEKDSETGNLVPDRTIPGGSELSGEYIAKNTEPQALVPNQERMAQDQSGLFVQPQAEVVQGVQPKADTEHKPANIQENKPFWENRIVTGNESPAPKKSVREDRALAVARPTTTPSSGEKQSRWRSSVFVSPTYGDLGLKMGFGYSVLYAVNDKISVGTGVAHSKVSALKHFTAPVPGAGSSLASSSPGEPSNALIAAARTASVITPAPYLDSVENLASGIEIPLDLNFKINQHMYVSGGLSGFYVIRNTSKYTYVNSQNVRITVESSSGSLKEDKVMYLSDYNITNTPLADTKKQPNLMGFYNLTLGYKQKVSPKNAVALEPFLKLPMKSVSDQRLNYTGMGVRVKFDF